MLLSPQSASFDMKKDTASTPWTGLPYEIIEQIICYLASFGSKYAVKAALVHPSFTAKALAITFEEGIEAIVRTKGQIYSLLNQMQQYESMTGNQAQMESLRITDNHLRYWRSRYTELILKNGTVSQNRRGPDTLEIICRDESEDLDIYSFPNRDQLKHLVLYNMSFFVFDLFYDDSLVSLTSENVCVRDIEDLVEMSPGITTCYFFYHHRRWTSLKGEDCYLANAGTSEEMPFIKLHASKDEKCRKQIFMINLEETKSMQRERHKLTRLEKVDLGVVYHLYHYAYSPDELK